MYLAIRELRAARGRFALLAAIIAMMTVLLVMLTGLTQGLGQRNTSALEALAPDQVMLVGDDTYAGSAVTEQQAQAYAAQPGVRSVTPLGIAQTRLNGTPVAVFGTPQEQQDNAELVVPASLGVRQGQEITLGGQRLVVTATRADEYYSHLPVVFVGTKQWQAIAREDHVGSVLLVQGEAVARPGDHVHSLKDSFAALPGYASERGSLLTMQAFLYGIAALVTTAFLSVWTVQRRREMAILTALGAAKWYLLRDALAQAAIVLGIGVLVGDLIGVALGAVVSVPFVASPVLPAVMVWTLGMVGAALSVRSVTKVNPNAALAQI